MVEADMDAIDNAISSGVLQNDLGSEQDVSYDENGNAIREYDSNAFSAFTGTQDVPADAPAPPVPCSEMQAICRKEISATIISFPFTNMTIPCTVSR